MVRCCCEVDGNKAIVSEAIGYILSSSIFFLLLYCFLSNFLRSLLQCKYSSKLVILPFTLF